MNEEQARQTVQLLSETATHGCAHCILGKVCNIGDNCLINLQTTAERLDFFEASAHLHYWHWIVRWHQFGSPDVDYMLTQLSFPMLEFVGYVNYGDPKNNELNYIEAFCHMCDGAPSAQRVAKLLYKGARNNLSHKLLRSMGIGYHRGRSVFRLVIENHHKSNRVEERVIVNAELLTRMSWQAIRDCIAELRQEAEGSERLERFNDYITGVNGRGQNKHTEFKCKRTTKNSLKQKVHEYIPRSNGQGIEISHEAKVTTPRVLSKNPKR